MDIVKYLEELNALLNKSFLFRGYKFLLVFYLTVIFLAIAGILFRIGRSYWTVLVSGQGFLHIKKGSYYHRWEKNFNLFEKGGVRERKIAVLEAAMMLNEVLEKIGYKKGKLGDKLSQMSSAQLTNLEEVKQANETKNKIVKDAKYTLSHNEAKEVIEAFERALESFEAI